MADFDPTFGCGSYLPGYGLPPDFVPPTSTGQPDDDVEVEIPTVLCVLENADFWETTYTSIPGYVVVTITAPLAKKEYYTADSFASEVVLANEFFVYAATPYVLAPTSPVTFSALNFGSYFAPNIIFGPAGPGDVAPETECEPIFIQYKYPVNTAPQITKIAPPLGQSPIEYVTALFTIEVHPGNVMTITKVLVSFGDGTSPVSIPYFYPTEPTSPTEYDFSHTYNKEGTFDLSVQVLTEDDIEATATFPIVVQDSPTTVTITDPGTVTVGTSFDVEATTTVAGGGAPTFIYEWFTNVASQEYVSKGGGNPKSLSFDTPGSVDIKVEASVGGEVLSSDEITITVEDDVTVPTTTVEIVASPATYYIGDSVLFTAVASEPGSYFHSWVVDDLYGVPFSTESVSLILLESSNPQLPSLGLGLHTIQVGVYSADQTTLIASSEPLAFDVVLPPDPGPGSGEL